MSTEAVLEANRRNSLLSTGPKTEEGKQASSRNSIRHGMLSNVIPKDIPEFHELLEGLHQSLQPQDEAQRFLVNQIAVCMLRITFIQSHDLEFYTESSGMSSEEKAQHVKDHLQSKATQLAHRYETAHNRQIEKNLKKLRDLKLQNLLQPDPTSLLVTQESQAVPEPLTDSAFSNPPSAFSSASFRNFACNAPKEPALESPPSIPAVKSSQ